jgi:hypothetical protein
MAKKSFLNNLAPSTSLKPAEKPIADKNATQAVKPTATPQKKGFLENYQGAALDGDAADVIPINLSNVSRKRNATTKTAKEIRLSTFVEADLLEKVQSLASRKAIPLQDIVNQLFRQYLQSNPMA